MSDFIFEVGVKLCVLVNGHILIRLLSSLESLAHLKLRELEIPLDALGLLVGPLPYKYGPILRYRE